MDEEKKYSIIIPAYNEAGAIRKTISEIKSLSNKLEIIVVDDCSTDNTRKLIDPNSVKLICHPINMGYGAALKTGIKHAHNENIIITDADGTYPNHMIPELIREYEKNDVDMLVGARVGKDAKIPLVRRPAKWVITHIAEYLSSAKIPDLNSGLRIMKKKIVEKYLNILPDGFSFTTTITLAMITNSYRVNYFQIQYYKRKGKSKIRPIHDTLNFVLLIIRTVMYFNPLKIFLPISITLLLAGIVLIIFQGIVYRNIATISILIALSGLQLLALGMIADLIDKKTK